MSELRTLEELPNSIIVERVEADVMLPAHATKHSAGMDLRAYLRGRSVKASNGLTLSDIQADVVNGEWGVLLAAGQMGLVPLGFRTRLPAGIEAQIRPRSGQVFKTGLTVPNAPGTIDADYAEEWMVMVRNDSPSPRRIVHGERIAQVVFASYATLPIEVGEVRRTTNRTGGFGSTGHK